MRKNAGIKSKEELRSRIESGETLYIDDHVLLCYEIGPVFLGGSPYRARIPGCRNTIAISGIWERFADVEVEVAWQADIGEGKLCWVWDDHEGCKRPRIVVKYSRGEVSYEDSYQDSDGLVWKHAILATRENLDKLLVKE